LHSSAVIADGGVKKSYAASAVAHIWVDNSNIKQLQMHSTYVTPNEAELMAVWTGERVQKGIAHWDKQNHAVPAPNCMLKVRGEIIKDEGL